MKLFTNNFDITSVNSNLDEKCKKMFQRHLRQQQEPWKKYELLKTSWTYQTREFFDHSTLHGVRYIAEGDRPFCEKLVQIFT